MYQPRIKNASIIDVIISLPLALLRTLPENCPSKIAIGVPIRAAIRSPVAPVNPQSWANIIPICPAIAPRGIPKLIPIPAMIGIMRESTKKVFLTILFESSFVI